MPAMTSCLFPFTATRWMLSRISLVTQMKQALAFIVSLDDFIITNFVKGAGIETLPTAIFGSVKQGLKPNIMAISTMLLGLSIVMVTISYFVSKSDNTK